MRRALLFALALSPSALAAPVDAALDGLEATSSRDLVTRTRTPGAAPHLVAGFRAGPYPGAPEAAALAFAADHAALLPLAEGHTLEVEQVLGGHAGTRVRLRQTAGGVPVWGGLAIVGVDEGGAVDLLRAELAAVDLPEAPPRVGPQDAARAVQAHLGVSRTSAPELVLLPGQGLAWHVLAWGEVGWTALVHAGRGEVLAASPVVRHAQGFAYPGRTSEGFDLVDLQGLTGEEGLVGERTTVQSQVWVGTTERALSNAVADEDGDFLYPPDGGSYVDAFAEVNAYYHLEHYRDWYADTLGYVHHPFVNALVNWQEEPGDDYYNAHATIGAGSTELRFGQGGEYDYAYPPGIVGHELTHGVLFQVLPPELLGYYWDQWGTSWVPWSLHEGIADYFPSSVLDERRAGEWEDGEYIRDLGRELHCPRNLQAEVHADGLVLVSALWVVREAVGAEVSDDLVWAAVNSFMPADGYDDFAAVLVSTAEAMADGGRITADEAAEVEAILEERGIVDCGRRVDLGEGGYTVSSMWGASTWGLECELLQDSGISFTMDQQAAITVPEDTEGLLHLDLDLEPREPWSDSPISRSELDYTVVVLREDLVAWDLDSFSGVPYTTGPIAATVEIGDSPTSLELTPEDGIDHEPGTTWTIAVYGANCVEVEYRVKASWTWEEVEVPDTDDPEDEEPGGCGCATPGSAPWLALLVLPALLLPRRRET